MKKFQKTFWILMSSLALSAPLWANRDGVTTASSFEQKNSLTLSYIENMLVLDRKMVASVQLAAFDDKYGRVEIKLTPEASKNIYNIKRTNKHQKLIFEINNQIAESVGIQKAINEDSFLMVISTSRKNADFIVKTLSK